MKRRQTDRPRTTLFNFRRQKICMTCAAIEKIVFKYADEMLGMAQVASEPEFVNYGAISASQTYI